MSERGFRDTLFQSLACGASYPGQAGELVAQPSPYFAEDCQRQLTPLDSFVSRAEQSNSSIVFGDRYILKLFRKLEPGINPDIEIGHYLTEHKFAHTPAVLGALEYRDASGIVYAAGILQEFVANEGDAWKYTLSSLSEFFGKALAQPNVLVLRTQDPLLLANEPVPSEVASLIGPYLASAALLGRRTAEMHIALASSSASAFQPELFTAEHANLLHQDLVAQALTTFALVREKHSSAELLSLEPRVLESFSFLLSKPITVSLIRHHGDYHLGQVLYTGSDFMIIDFEGEPARPLAERRARTVALKDVAGMLRSFHYAAYAAMYGLVSGVPTDAESLAKVDKWAAVWSAWVGAAYLRAYFDQAEGYAFTPSSEQERRTLLHAFLLQKALYEVAYELNNRPGWVGIPIRGIVSLVQ